MIKIEIEVNFEELAEQNKELILKSGKFAHAEILIGKDNDLPYAQFNTQEAGLIEIAMLIKTMEEMVNAIINKEPLVLKALDAISINKTIITTAGEDGYQIMKGGEE